MNTSEKGKDKVETSNYSAPNKEDIIRRELKKAAAAGDLEKVEELLASLTSDPHLQWDQQNKEMLSEILRIATANGRIEVVKVIPAAAMGMKWDKKILSKVTNIGALKGETAILKFLLEIPVDDQWTKDDYIELIHFAIKEHRIGTAQMLLDISGMQWTEEILSNALVRAENHVPIVEWLLKTSGIQPSEKVVKKALGLTVMQGYKKAKDDEDKKELDLYKEVAEMLLAAAPDIQQNKEMLKIINQIKGGDRRVFCFKCVNIF